MTGFLIYLLESGLCLSLLYAAYWLLLRKETYFHFIRIYLVGSIFLALIVPVIHLNFMIEPGSTLTEPASGIIKFRNYYEELIGMSNADFGAEPDSRHFKGINSGREQTYPDYYSADYSSGNRPLGSDEIGGSINPEKNVFRLSLAKLLVIIYIAGVVYFLARFVYLVIRLRMLAKRNGFIRQKDFRMVEIEEDISPFSFFRFLFINHRFFNESELENVLEHEKAHIRQKHSIDHLLAHGMAVFQWFNPFAWKLSDALKTTHEYIADRQVIEKGFERFDYQSLLLRQVIGYHSTELVNNFNLKPIKKRIVMMNKNKSGIPAKLKALLVVPFAIATFIIFADFTLADERNSFFEYTKGKEKQLSKAELRGLWIKKSEDPFSKIVHFDNDLMSYFSGDLINSSSWTTSKGMIKLNPEDPGNAIELKAEKTGNTLVIWWNDTRSSLYEKSTAENTLDHFLKKQDMELDLPSISQFRMMENEDLVYKICMGLKDGKPAVSFNGLPVELNDLPVLMEKERSKHSKIDVKSLTGMLFIDNNMPMKEVDRLKKSLREIKALKIADSGYPLGEKKVSSLLYHQVALPRLLPPADVELMDKNDMKKKGMKIMEIVLSSENESSIDLYTDLKDFISKYSDEKYLLSLEYDEDIPYERYIETVDMVFNVVYEFRDELAREEYGLPYASLGGDLQKKIRKAYPMMLTEGWR